MDALEKAKQLVVDAFFDEHGRKDVMRQDAAIHAVIATAERLERIAAALERIAGKRGIVGVINAGSE